MFMLLDVAIGVSLVYLSLALVVTATQELLASLFAWRAKQLYRALAEIVTGTVVGDDGNSKLLAQALYEHPLVRHLADRAPEFVRGRPSLLGRGLPSYIPSRAFAVALVDVLRGTRGAADAIGAGTLLAGARSSIEKVADPELKRVLTLLIGDADQLAQTVNDRSRLVSEQLETWFNDRMARAEGWYKRRAQAWSLGLALAVTVLFNADTLHLTERLWNDGALRAAVVAMAQAQEPPPASDRDDVAEQLVARAQALETAVLPLGWYWEDGAALPCARRANGVARACWQPSIWSRTLLLFGWLVTALAVSLGATFWFDLLSRALRLRGTGAKVSAATGRVAGSTAEVPP